MATLNATNVLFKDYYLSVLNERQPVIVAEVELDGQLVEGDTVSFPATITNALADYVNEGGHVTICGFNERPADILNQVVDIDTLDDSGTIIFNLTKSSNGYKADIHLYYYINMFLWF